MVSVDAATALWEAFSTAMALIVDETLIVMGC
jgi:hypothetical protein